MYHLDMYEESKNCSTACGRKQVFKLFSTISTFGNQQRSFQVPVRTYEHFPRFSQNSLNVLLHSTVYPAYNILLTKCYSFAYQEIYTYQRHKVHKVHMYSGHQSRKLKSRYGPMNQFQEPSLEMSSQATQAGGPVRQPYAYLVTSPHSGT